MRKLLRKSRPLIGIDRHFHDQNSGNFDDKFVVLEIAHGGDGFDKQDAKRVNVETFIFNPSEIHGGGGRGGGTGSGLGLSLAKTIVEAHGGRLWVKSAGVGRGSVFAMGIPLGSGVCEVLDLHPKIGSKKEELLSDWSGKSNKTNTHSLLTNTSHVQPVPNSTKIPALGPNGIVAMLSLQNPQIDDNHSTPTSPLMSLPPSSRDGMATKDSRVSGICSVGDLAALTEKGTDSCLLGMHALVVEDSKVARTMLVKLLKSLKCTTEEAEDGAMAVDMVSAIINYENDHSNDSTERQNNTFDGTEATHVFKPPSFDFILCDSVMPLMDGPTAVQKIRAMGYDKPIIGVTGNTLPEQIQDFMEHGADEIVTKPVKLAVLKETICRRCNIAILDTSNHVKGNISPSHARDKGHSPKTGRTSPHAGGGASPANGNVENV